MSGRRKRSAGDFEAEIRAHLEHEADRLRDAGVPDAEAESMARRAFGNVTAAEERFYESGRVLFLDRLAQDTRQALRSLARSPVFTLAATLSLALGIGANTAIYSVVDALLLRPYPFPELERLVTISELHPQQGRTGVRPSDPGYPLASADFLDVRQSGRSFQALAAFRSVDFTLVGEGEAQRLAGRLVSPELFDLVGVGAEQGRTFRRDEAEAGRDDVVVVSHGFWQSRLGATSDVLDRSLILNGRARRVIGVMPEGFRYPAGGVEVWAPLVFSDADKSERGKLSVAVVGRLAQSVTLAQARDELQAVGAWLGQSYPRTNAGRSFKVVPLREQQAGLTAPFAALFQAAALLVLLVACANVAGVLLARGLARRSEMALRAALGGSRSRLVRQLLTESLILSALGLALALGVASAGVRLIRSSVPPDITQWVAGWSEIRLDARALAVAAGLALVTALATGLRPALTAARLSQSGALRHGARGSAAGGGHRRAFIVVTQMALSLVLLVAAASMLRGFGRLSERYDSLEPERVLSFHLRLPDERYPAGRPVADFYARLVGEIAGMPGVEAAGAVAQLPGDLGPVPGGAVSIRGRSVAGDLDLPAADHQVVTPDYFRALRVRLVAGRLLGPQDGADAPPVALVSRSMAERLWPAGNTLGQQVKQGAPDAATPWREVVGVVEDVTQYWFDPEARSTLYLPLAQAPRPGVFVVVRAAGAGSALAPAVRARVAALDPALPLDELRTLGRAVDDGMAFLRLASTLLWVFGAVALSLSALGVYGVMAQDVASRTSEIGVRLALGASRGQVWRAVLGHALRLSAVALLFGVPAAVALGRLLEARLFGVARADAMGLAVFSAVICGAALLSALSPAIRAAAVDPAAILRAE
jgi:putative ABC transport system permease protein